MDKDIVGAKISIGDIVALISPGARRVTLGMVLGFDKERFKVQRIFWNDFFKRWQLFKKRLPFKSDRLFVVNKEDVPPKLRKLFEKTLEEYLAREALENEIRKDTDPRFAYRGSRRN